MWISGGSSIFPRGRQSQKRAFTIIWHNFKIAQNCMKMKKWTEGASFMRPLRFAIVNMPLNIQSNMLCIWKDKFHNNFAKTIIYFFLTYHESCYWSVHCWKSHHILKVTLKVYIYHAWQLVVRRQVDTRHNQNLHCQTAHGWVINLQADNQWAVLFCNSLFATYK